MHIPCPQCGSTNTIVENGPPVPKILKKLFPQEQMLKPGKCVVTCRDCGKKLVLMVN